VLTFFLLIGCQLIDLVESAGLLELLNMRGDCVTRGATEFYVAATAGLLVAWFVAGMLFICCRW